LRKNKPVWDQYKSKLLTNTQAMNVRSIIILVVTAGWFWFCQHAYVCWIKQACGDRTEQPAERSDGEQVLPLSFRYNQAEPEVHPEAFPTFREKKTLRNEGK
jgi:hypothetical protein